MTSTTQYTFNGVADVLAKSVTTAITGAVFSDGAILSGSWTANYDARGNLLDQVTGTFTVTGPAGTATFTAAGTLPYANTPGASSYEIHFLCRTGNGYDGLYVDWKGQTPSALALGTPSLYTSVLAAGSSAPLRLVGVGAVAGAATCFLSGTRLLTPAGEVAIEQLRAGDIVSVLRDGVLAAEPIRWVGSRAVDRADGIVPVRIRAGAFGPGLPHADLLVTPEHCILVDGVLVPARMLVNGAGIVADATIVRFTFHHVELDRHGILLAEGLTTESYLDTGNRDNFAGGAVTTIRPALAIDPACASWQEDACAPLRTDRDTVEPIWRRLAAHAVDAGFGPLVPPAGELSDDPVLRLLLDGGRALEIWSRDADRVVFWVPEGDTPVALLSRAISPSDMVGPFVDDRRRLGVKVSELRYGEALEAAPIDLAILPSSGWHAAEPDGRWTDGAAQLSLWPAGTQATMLTVRITATMRYSPEGQGFDAVA